MKKLRRIILIFWLVLPALFLFCPNARSVDYRIGEGDVLKITVYGHNDLQTIERVSGDGTIIFPLLGQINVDGMTVSEVSEHIAKGLSNGYIVNPQVSVFVQEFRSRKAVIMGEVAKPGLYELKGKTTLLELVSMAGGLKPDAGDNANIKRVDSKGETEIIEVDLMAIIESGDATLDVPVYDGDSIYISKAGVFFITGEVKKPNEYKFTPGTTVIKAISMAGGFTDKAAEKKVKIVRQAKGTETVLENVAMDEPVLPDDVIVVPESLF